MKRLLALVFFSLLLGLISGPIAMSMETIDIDDQLELVADNIDANDMQFEAELQLFILSGGLDLKYPTQELNTYTMISAKIWLNSQLNDITLSTEETTRLNDQSPMANSLASIIQLQGPPRLGLYEFNASHGNWQT